MLERKNINKASREKTMKLTVGDQKFKKEVASRLGGKRINLCYQCGTCVGSCPEASVSPKVFYPRLIIAWIQLGLRHKVLSSDDIWVCAFCYRCHERCPEGLSLPDIWLVLRNIAVENGFIPSGPYKLVKTLVETGRTLAMDEGLNEWREEAGLPKIGLTASAGALRDLTKIAEVTGFDKVLKLRRG